MGIDWAVIIEMILEMIQACMEDRQRTEARLNNPGVGEAWMLRKVLRKEGLRGKRLRKEIRNGMDYLANMTPDEIKADLDELED